MIIDGTTSACAENTLYSIWTVGPSGNYLRVRGEYAIEPTILRTPHGTTSACAENTRVVCATVTVIRNYLRVRGEYTQLKAALAAQQELPPRARRIRPDRNHKIERNGTTSACAENTNHGAMALKPWGNYLRVRGEYQEKHHGYLLFVELPPRARRIQASNT